LSLNPDRYSQCYRLRIPCDPKSQTGFIIAGFGLILYDVLVKDRRERERRRETIRNMENGEPDIE